jgi:hypothetical protein
VAGCESRGHAVRAGRDHAHAAEVGADAGRGHERVVRGAVELAAATEVTPPLDPDSPGVPHERGARVDADEQNGGLGDVVPALDVHPEPVVHKRVPEVLLALHEVPVGTVERPFARAFGYESRDSRLLLTALRGLRPRVLGVLHGLAAPLLRGGALCAGVIDVAHLSHRHLSLRRFHRSGRIRDRSGVHPGLSRAGWGTPDRVARWRGGRDRGPGPRRRSRAAGRRDGTSRRCVRGFRSRRTRRRG